MARVELAATPTGVVVNSAFEPVAGANVMIYTTGTTTPVSVYSDATTSTLLSQPLLTGADGQIPGWLTPFQTVDVVVTLGGTTYPTWQTEVVRGDSTAQLNPGTAQLVLSQLPTHASTHETGGSDPISPATIGAATIAQAASALQIANNLADVNSASTSRTNLGLGSAATQASSAFDAAGAATAAQAASLQKSSNLSDVANAATARGNLAAAPLASPTFTGTPAAPTATVGTSTTQLATTAFVATAVSGVGGRPTYIFRTVHSFNVTGSLAVPSGSADLSNYLPPFFVSLGANETVKLVKCWYVIGTGTSVTVTVNRNGAAVTGLTGVSVTTTAASTTPTAVALAEGDYLAPAVTAISGSPGNLSFTIVLEHTLT